MKRIIYTITLTAAVLGMTSCGENFLYKDPQGSFSGTMFENAQGVELLTTNAYANLTENGWGATPFNWVFGSIIGGDANKGSSAGDQSVINEIETYAPLTTNDYVRQKWEWTYKGVQRCNIALRALKKAKDIAADVAKSREGELFFLRSLYYFEGVKLMGPASLAWIPWDNEEDDPKVYNGTDIYPNIMAEIDQAISLLPEKQSEVGRVNVWAAKALKAKMLMQQGKMAEAKPVLADLLANGQTSNGLKYGLEDDLNNNFNAFKDNGKESIFAVQHSLDANNNGLPGYSLNFPHNVNKNAPGGCCGFFQPSYDLVNSYQVDADGLPYLDYSYRSKPSVSVFDGSAPAGSQFKNDFTIAVDPRLDFAVGRQGVPYKDWDICFKDGYGIRDKGNGGIFLPKKHVWTKAEEEAGLASRSRYAGWAPAVALNMQYLSVRDMILLYAECLANDGELSAAMEQVNKIRTRAGNAANIIQFPDGKGQKYVVKTYPSTHAAFTDKNTCITAIRFERKLELAMEGQRWYDYARWGKEVMKKETSAYVMYEKQYLSKFASASTTFDKVYFFVPDAQIKDKGVDENGKPYLVQNDLWK